MKKCHACGRKGYWFQRLLSRFNAVLCDDCYKRQKGDQRKSQSERALNKFVPPKEAW